MPDSHPSAAPATDGPARSQKSRRAVSIVVAIAFALGITLLWVIPPIISYGTTTAAVSCRALGPGMVGTVVSHGFPSYWPTFSAVDERLFDQTPLPSDAEFLTAKLGAAEACGQARMNRLSSIILVSATGLAALLAVVILNQRKMLATLRDPRFSSLRNS